MWNFLTKLVEKIPARFAAILVAVSIGGALIWFSVIAGAALFTNRQVEFFPPKIGTDPQLRAELKTLTERLTQTIKEEQDFRRSMVTGALGLRGAAAGYRQQGQDKIADELINGADKMEAQIKQSEERLEERFRALEASLGQLKKRL